MWGEVTYTTGLKGCRGSDCGHGPASGFFTVPVFPKISVALMPFFYWSDQITKTQHRLAGRYEGT
jgi:hypothetical protein